MSPIFEAAVQELGRRPRLDDLVDVLETLQEICDWSLQHNWSVDQMRLFMQHIHGDIGYAVDLAIADAAFNVRGER